MEQKSDRRVKLTKRILHETLIELLQSSHVSELSVKRICEAADLNRSTFYAHYQSPIELFHEIEQEAYEDLTVYLSKGCFEHTADSSRPFMIYTLEYIKRNPKLFKVLLGSNDSTKLKEISLAVTKNYFSNQKMNPPKKKHYMQHFFVAGWTAVMEEWLNNGCLESPDEICDYVINLIDFSQL